MMQKVFALEANATPEFITEQIGQYFYPSKRWQLPKGYWEGFMVIGRKFESQIKNPRTQLRVFGIPHGAHDPTLDRIDADGLDADAEQVTAVSFKGTAVRRAAQILLTLISTYPTRTHVQFELDDADLMPLFLDLAGIIVPKIPAQSSDATPTEPTRMIYIQEQAERFDQWINQLASEHGYTLLVDRERALWRYGLKVNGKDIAEVETFQVGTRLRLRAKRQGVEIKPNGQQHGGFLQILNAALVKDYQAEPLENYLEEFAYWIGDGFSNVQFDDPNEEKKRQEYVAELRRGLPMIQNLNTATDGGTEFEATQMKKIIATMSVMAELQGVRDAIAGHIRDGVISRPSTPAIPGLVESLNMQECEPLGNERRRVWLVGDCAIIAEYRRDDLTEIKLIGVRGILYNNDEAEQDWRLIEGEFIKAGLLDTSASASGNTGDNVTPADERELIESKTKPEFVDEQEFKNNKREFYRTTPVHDRLHLDHDSGRFYTAEEIEIHVEGDWEGHKRRIGELKARWDEIHSFDGQTTEKVTELYLAQNAQIELATMQPQGATPNIERKYRTTRESLERMVKDFTRKWLRDSAQCAPFTDVRVESIGQVQIEIQGKCESRKGLELFFDYLPMVILTPTIISVNAEWLKVEAWAMNWTDHPDAKKTVDNFLAALIQELDYYLSDVPRADPTTIQSQEATPTLAPTEPATAQVQSPNYSEKNKKDKTLLEAYAPLIAAVFEEQRRTDMANAEGAVDRFHKAMAARRAQEQDATPTEAETMQARSSDATSNNPTTSAATDAAQAGDATQVQCVFEKKGTAWEITYSTKPFIRQESKGLAYIITLLKNPNKDFDSTQLVRAVRKDSATEVQISVSELIEEGLEISDSNRAVMVLDERAKRDYLNRLEEVREKRKIATDLGRDSEVQECEDEEEKIVQELSRTTHAGRSKQFSGQSEKARLAVLGAIKRERSKIKEQDDALGDYLATTIETGGACVYRPDKADKPMPLFFKD